jgi:hypothetical protein
MVARYTRDCSPVAFLAVDTHDLGPPFIDRPEEISTPRSVFTEVQEVRR